MKKIVAGGAACALAVALGVWVAWQPAAAAQRPDVFTLIGPGSAIGVTVREVTPADAEKAKLAAPAGVLVEAVRPDSPAERAGFRVGDIVLDFNGERVVSVRQFTRIVRESAPRREVDAVVVRGTARQTVKVIPDGGGEVTVAPQIGDLGPRLQRELRDFNLNIDPNILQFRELGLGGGRALGVSVMPLGDQLAAYFGVSGGALVTDVESGTPAAEAGLKAGDVITAIDGRTIREPADVRRELARAPGEAVDIAVTREKKSLLLKATIPSRDSRSGRRGLPV